VHRGDEESSQTINVMIDRTKKQTNLGIILAVIGFTLIGGALVLIPKLVDEKIKSYRFQEPPAGAPDATATRPSAAIKADTIQVADNRPTDTLSQTPAEDSGDDDTRQSDNGAAEAQKAQKPESDDSPPLAQESKSTAGSDPWKLVLVDKYEPDAASKVKLQSIIEKMKSTPGMRLKIVGMNNINKTSKLAQIGANRIQAMILKEAGVVVERTETAVEQQPDMKGIHVRIFAVGGAQ
jgi:hypothetical protein